MIVTVEDKKEEVYLDYDSHIPNVQSFSIQNKLNCRKWEVKLSICPNGMNRECYTTIILTTQWLK